MQPAELCMGRNSLEVWGSTYTSQKRLDENWELVIWAQCLTYQLWQVAEAKTAEPGAKMLSEFDSLLVWLKNPSSVCYGSLAGGWVWDQTLLTNKRLKTEAPLSQADRKRWRCVAQDGRSPAIFIISGTNWLEEMVRELESADAKYTEDEMKERINAEKELQMFPRLEFGDPGIYEVGRVSKYWQYSCYR